MVAKIIGIIFEQILQTLKNATWYHGQFDRKLSCSQNMLCSYLFSCKVFIALNGKRFQHHWFSCIY